MKKCKKCGETKESSDFRPQRRQCKGCDKDQAQAFKKTKVGLICTIYTHQKEHSKHRGHRPPEYTKESLIEWALSQTLFHELHEEWVQSGFKKRLRPSVDRKYNDIHYCMNNIQLMTFKENQDKWFMEVRRGEETQKSNPQKPVLQFTKKGEFMAEYHSQAEAARQTGFLQCKISEVCRGNRNHTGGYVWQYKHTEEV